MKRISLVLLFLITAVAIWGQSSAGRLSLEHYGDYEWTSNPQLSPDGSQVIYTRHWINLRDDRRESDLWIVRIDGSRNRFFANGSDGYWSPDGSRIAFTRPGEPDGTQVFVKYVDEEGEPTQVTRLPSSPGNLTWSPDGQYLAFTMHVDQAATWKIDIPSMPEGAKWTKAPTVIDKPVYRRDRIGFLEPGYRHVFVVPADGGTARQLTGGDWDHGGQIAWSADGRRIFFSSFRHPDADYALGQSNLYAVEVGNGAITEVTTREGREYDPAVSPDGKQIAFVGSLYTENFYHEQRLFVMNADGSGVRMLSAGLDRNPDSPMWAPDNSGVYFNVDDQGTRNLYFADLSGEVRPVTSGTHMLTTSGINQQGKAVGIRTSFQDPPDVVTFDLKKPDIRQLTDVNADILDFLQLGKVEEVRYKSADGQEVQGWLVMPPDFDPNKKYPLILRIHGGPHAMYNVGFDFSFQVHAAGGALVLYTNPRGSTGYGYDFANAIQNAYPGKDYDDLMNGVDAIVARGIVDEQKLYVYGGSGGGVLTSWIIGHTDRFAAASVNYPVTNWLSFVGTTDGIGWYRNFEKYPWEDPSEHLRRSPLMYVGNVTTPTMLMCGVNDLRTPISQTEEYYQALQVRKVPSVMIRFNDEFHGTSSKPSNFLRTMGYLTSWFAKHAKGTTQP